MTKWCPNPNHWSIRLEVGTLSEDNNGFAIKRRNGLGLIFNLIQNVPLKSKCKNSNIFINWPTHGLTFIPGTYQRIFTGTFLA